MKLAAFPPVFTKVVRDLAKALGRFEEPQGRIARRYARREVLRVQARIRAAVDKAFAPPARRKRSEHERSEEFSYGHRQKEKSAAQRSALFKRKMLGRGYGQVGDVMLATAILEGGVRIKRPPKRSDLKIPYAPNWAVLAALENAPPGKYNVEKIREAKRSTRVRQALLAAARLTGRLP